MNKKTIKARLAAAGLDTNLTGYIYQRIYYADLAGDSPEDFLQEAIVAGLAGENIKTVLSRLKNTTRSEISLDAAKEDEASAILEGRASDNERPDWIPQTHEERSGLFDACLACVQRSYRTTSKGRLGHQARLSMLGHQQHLAWAPSDEERGQVERQSLSTIMGWVTPLPD